MKLDELTEPSDRYARLLRHNAVFFKHRRTMLEIYDVIDKGLYERAYEAFGEIPNADQIDINIPKSKGGFFWPHERQIVVRGVDPTTGWSVWREKVSETAGDRL